MKHAIVGVFTGKGAASEGSMKMKSFLAIVHVKCCRRYRSPDRPPDGVRRGYMNAITNGFMDDQGWLWNGKGCTRTILWKSERKVIHDYPHWPMKRDEQAARLFK